MTLPTPNLAQDMIRVHKVITRSIDVGLIKGIQYVKTGFPDPQELTGYSIYTHCLAEILDSHHMAEDKIGFPALFHVLPAAPYAHLTAEHHQFEHLLGILRPAIENLSTETQAKLKIIVENLQKISLMWPPHYLIEEKHFTSEAVNAVMSLDEQKRVTEATSNYSQEHASPPYWVIPFMLFNLEKDDRELIAATLPPAVVEEQVPKVWKDQWAPMKPLLLD
jgi:hemerythrin-like domain-containing protein